MQIVDKYGNTFGQGHLIVTSKSGKPKVPTVTVEWGNITGILKKQSDLQKALDLKVPIDRTITINGNTQDLSADRTWTISTGITIGSTSITSGTVGRILFEGAGNVVQESANITWDNTNLLFALGSTATRIFNFRPEDTTGAYGNSCSIRGGNGNGRIDFYSASNITEVRDNIILLTSVTGPSVQVGTGSINLNVASSTRLQVAPTTGNVLINTTTDAGYKLDVNGTAAIRGTTNVIGGTLRIASTGTLTQPSYITSHSDGGWNYTTYTHERGAGVHYFTSNNGSASIFSASAREGVIINVNSLTTGNPFSISGTVSASSAIARGQLINTTLVAAANNDVLIGLDIAPTFTNGAFTGVSNWAMRLYNSIRFETPSDLSQGIFWKPANDGTTLRIYGSTFSAGIGFLQLNVQSGSDGLSVNGGARTLSINAALSSISLNLNNILFNTHGTGEAARIVVSTKNFLIGTTTDAGYKLDVAGTGRFTGNVTMSSGTSLTIGNIQLFDDTSGTRIIQALANQGILLRAGSNSIILANSAGSGITTFSTTGTHIFRPSSISSGGLVFSASGVIPTSTTITFSRIRNDGDKLGVINTEDFAVSGATPINLFIYAGRETVLNNQGNLILAHDGTITRGNVLIGTSTNGSFKLDVNGSARVQSGLTVSGSLNLNSSDLSSAWTAYTPTWSTDGATQPSLGDGTITGAYKVIGKTVFVRVRLVFGTTTTAGTGAFYFSLPVSAAAAWGIQMPVSILDNGNAWYQATVNGEYGGFTDRVALITQSAGGANSSQGVTGVFPITFANTDSIQFNGSYESA